MRLPSHKDTGIGAVATLDTKRGVKRVLEKQASQQSAKKWKQYCNFADTNRAKIGQYASITVTTSVLVKTEGGAKLGITHLQR